MNTGVLSAISASVIAGVLALAIHNYKRLKRTGAGAINAPSMELTTDLDQLPRYTWLFFVPMLALLAAALYLNRHWADIPARYPIHWDDNGHVNGWNTKSVRGIYGPLIFAALWLSWFAAVAFAAWHYSARSPFRTAMLKTMLASSTGFSFAFVAVALMPVLHLPPGALALGIVAGVVFTIVFSIAAFQSATNTTVETGQKISPVPNSAAWFTPRADGLGFCPNWNTAGALILMLWPVLIVAFGIPLLL